MSDTELSAKLSSLRGKFEFLQAQKADNEAKKEKLMTELKKLGFTTVEELKVSLEKNETEIQSLEAKLSSAIAEAEAATKLLEDRVAGKAPVSLPPINIPAAPKPVVEDEL